MLLAVRNFAQVIPGLLYRGAQPHSQFEYDWLAQMGVKGLVNLRTAATAREQRNADRLGFSLVTLGVVDDTAPSVEQARTFITMLQQARNYPLYVHCKHGHGRTSTFCILARLAQGASLEAAFAEQHTLGYVPVHVSQREFLVTMAPVIAADPAWHLPTKGGLDDALAYAL